MSVAITYCAVLLFSQAVGPGLSPEKRFAEAQVIFDAAKAAMAQPDGDTINARTQFYDAATRFAALAHQGIRSANLYVNAGNAFHFAGDDASALLWYLRANRLSNTIETRSGLITLRSASGAELWPHDQGSIGRALMFWHHDLGRPFKHWVLLGTYPLGCLMVILALLVRRRSFWLRLGIALIVIGATMGVSDLVATAAGDGQWAVVLEDGRGYAGDGEGYSVILDHVTRGQEVKILESREDWVHAEFPSGTTCWLPAGICEPV